RRVAAGVPRGGGVDARRRPELLLRAPEAAEADDHLLEPLRERRPQRRAEHVVGGGHRHLRTATRQRRLGRHHLRLPAEKPHEDLPSVHYPTSRRPITSFGGAVPAEALPLPSGPPASRFPHLQLAFDFGSGAVNERRFVLLPPPAHSGVQMPLPSGI